MTPGASISLHREAWAGGFAGAHGGQISVLRRSLGLWVGLKGWRGGPSQEADQRGQPAGQALVYFILSTDWRAVIVEGKQRCFSLRLLVALMSVD